MGMRQMFAVLGLGLGLALSACSDEAPTAGSSTSEPTSATSAAPVPTGNVIEVKMVTDGASNYFEPAEITAGPGDVVRFVLVSGVHNVSFPAQLNSGAAKLPTASTFLAQPGQTFDVPVDLAPGSYTFHCDPHAALGMVGTLTVN